MRPVRAVVALVGVALLVSLVGASGGTAPAAAQATPNGTVGNATAGPLGAHLSAFMQSNAARATDAVETEMWAAAYEGAATNGTRAALVRRQAGRLEKRIERLREEKAALEAARQNGTIPPVAYRARMSRIAGRLAALTEAIDETERRAAQAGVDESRLEALRRRADAVADGPVSRIARGLVAGENRTIGPPDVFGDGDRGPPDGGGPGNASDRGGSPDGTQRGPPPDRGNASEGGPPENRGNESGPPDAAGNASGSGGPPDTAGNESNGGGPPDGAGNESDGDGKDPPANGSSGSGGGRGSGASDSGGNGNSGASDGGSGGNGSDGGSDSGDGSSGGNGSDGGAGSGDGGGNDGGSDSSGNGNGGSDGGNSNDGGSGKGSGGGQGRGN